MRIGELSRRTGVPTRMLRYYEEQDLLHPERAANGYRRYSAAAVHRVQQIRGLLDAGLTMARRSRRSSAVTGCAVVATRPSAHSRCGRAIALSIATRPPMLRPMTAAVSTASASSRLQTSSESSAIVTDPGRGGLSL
jgi:hypothetical protein